MTFSNLSPELISMAGESNDQKLAAIITPPVKPSIPFISFLFTPLKRNTPDAPKAVTPQVNKPANKAATTGSNVPKYATSSSNIFRIIYFGLKILYSFYIQQPIPFII